MADSVNRKPIQDAIQFDHMSIELVSVSGVAIFRVYGWVVESKILIDSFENFELAHQSYPEACPPKENANGES